MATNFGQNNSNEISLNTRGFSFYGDLKTMLTPCSLAVGFWNEMISITFNPALPEGQRGEKVYDYDKSILTSLSSDKAHMLLKGINEVLLADMDKTVNVGVPVGGDGMLCVGRDSKGYYVALFKGIDPETKRSSNVQRFDFGYRTVLMNYNNENGEYSNFEVNEFELFIRFLKVAVDSLTNGFAHTVRNTQKYLDRRVHTTIGNIADKVGAESALSNGNYKGRKSQNIDWGFSGSNGKSNTTPSMDASEDALDSLDDIPF